MSEWGAAAALLQRMCSAARAEACAAAERLVAIGELVSLRLAQDAGATELWVVDATDAVTLEVAAALGISRDLAASHVRYAHALRFSLPRLGRAFIAGDVHTGFLDANPQIAAEPELAPSTLQALLAAASLSTKTMRDGADAIPDLHAALGAWRN